MSDAPITELASDMDTSAEPWSERALRETYRRRVRAKIKQAELDRDAGLHRKGQMRLEHEAREAARRDIERGVNVENERRRELGLPVVELAKY